MKQQDNDIDDYASRLIDLIKEARGHGIASYAILYTTDPISQTSQTRYLRTADHILAMGMLQAANVYLQDEYFEGDLEDGEEGIGA